VGAWRVLTGKANTRHVVLRVDWKPAKIIAYWQRPLVTLAERLTTRQGPLATMVLHALIALAPSWWPGPRLGQDRVHPVERHQ